MKKEQITKGQGLLEEIDSIKRAILSIDKGVFIKTSFNIFSAMSTGKPGKPMIVFDSNTVSGKTLNVELTGEAVDKVVETLRGLLNYRLNLKEKEFELL